MKTDWKTCLRLGVTIFLLYLAIHYWTGAVSFVGALLSAAAPLLIGIIIAYPVNILMSWYERHWFPRTEKPWLIRLRRPVCMVTAFVTLVAVVALVVRLVVPQLVDCVQLLLSMVPGAMRTVIGWLDTLELVPEDIIAALSSIDWQSRIGQIARALTSGLGNVMDVVITAVTSIFSGILTGILSFIFAIYLLLDRDTLCRQCSAVMKRYLPVRWHERIMHVLSILHDCFRRYVVGQCTEAVILGVLCALGMLALRLPYATMIGALVAFTALIPVAGAFIGAGLGAFMILTVSPLQALIFLIFFVVLQQIEGNVIYPRVVGSSMGLPAIWVLTAVTIGGGLLGIAGMLLSVPLAATGYRLLREDIRRDASCGDVPCSTDIST